MPERLIKYLFSLALIACSLLCSCTEDDTIAEPNNVLMAISVDTRADETGSTEAISEAEKAVYSLRVYAFVNGRPAGHHFVEGSNLSVPMQFFMDVAFYSASNQKVDFYLIANEKAMTTPSISLRERGENVSENELKTMFFHGVDITLANGLPMFCVAQETLNFADSKPVSESDFPGYMNTSEHNGHHVINKPLSFSLARPFAKLDVYATKHFDDKGSDDLIIKSVTVLNQGTRTSNYLMPQDVATLKAMNDKAQGDVYLTLLNNGVVKSNMVSPEGLTEDEYMAERRKSEHYTSLLARNHYPFENPYSNGGAWDAPGADKKEFALKIEYQFGSGEVREGYVYMPPIERNHYYKVLCLMNNTGKITIEYEVDDWDYNEETNNYGTLEFEYPTYNNPLIPFNLWDKPESANPPYTQPTVGATSSWTGDDVYEFYFNISHPEGLKWTPQLIDVDENTATADKFEYTVFKYISNETSGEWKEIKRPEEGAETETDPTLYKDGHYVAPGQFKISVRAKEPLEDLDKDGKLDERTVNLGISFIPIWAAYQPPLLMINGMGSGTKPWGGNDEQVISIKQDR